MLIQATHYQQSVNVQSTQKEAGVTGNRQAVPAPAETDRVILSTELMTGMELVERFGTIALGGSEQLEQWANKGLEVSEETLQKAFDVFNEAFAVHVNKSAGPSSFSFNAHQIIADSQPVPDWFLDEQESELAKILDINVKDAFLSGSTYFVHNLSITHHKAITAYEQVLAHGE